MKAALAQRPLVRIAVIESDPEIVQNEFGIHPRTNPQRGTLNTAVWRAYH
jgi:hypothetical protein